METKQKTFNTWEVFGPNGDSVGWVRREPSGEWRTFPVASVQGAPYATFADACAALSPANKQSDDYGCAFRFLEVD